jgi:MFS family permease
MIVALLADLQDAYHLPTWGLGLIAGVNFVAAFIAYMWLSGFADRGYAKRMLMIGALVAMAALAWTAFARDLWSLVVARALFGLAEGAYVPSARRVALDWTPDRPGEELGKLMAAGTAGFALGPVIGGVLASAFGLVVPFLVPAVVLAALFPILVRIRPAPVAVTAERGRLGRVLRIRGAWLGILIASTEFVAIGAFDAIWARLLTDRGASTVFIGVSFVAFVLPIVALASTWGRVADTTTPWNVGMAAAGVSVPALLLYGVLDSPIALTVFSGVHGIVAGAIQPASASLVARTVPRDSIATGQGLLESVGFLVAAAVALPSGWAYERLGARGLFGVVTIVAALPIVVAWRISTPSLRRPGVIAGE